MSVKRIKKRKNSLIIAGCGFGFRYCEIKHLDNLHR